VLRRLYSAVAALWLVATIAVVAFCLIATVVVRRDDATARRAALAALNRRALISVNGDEASELLRTFVQQREALIRYPWVARSEPVFHSPRFNVDSNHPLPIRRTASPAAATKTVWLFGDSAAFGFGVPDDQTIASHLQAALARAMPQADVRVINHGHTDFGSEKQLLLFQWLLRSGARADVAVFLQDAAEAPPAANDAPAAGTNFVEPIVQVSDAFPPRRLLIALFRRFRPHPKAPPDRTAADISVIRTVASAFQVNTLFVWQPVRAAVKARPGGGNDVIDLSSLFATAPPNSVYLDSHHYGDAASRALADSIAGALLQRGAIR
jgi:hypothetical protein